MYIRPKTKRRLLILGSTFGLIVGLLVVGYLVRARRLEGQIARSRAEAMAAHAAGDHVAALEAFRFYLDESKAAERGPEGADAEAILAYAKSRAAVETDKGRHLVEAVKILELYARLRPGDAEARRMLFELQPRIGYNDEARQLADAALAENPADVDALRTRVRALRNKGQQDRAAYAEALATSERLNAVAPLDLPGQVETLRLMLLSRRPDADVVGRAESLRAAHKGDPRFDLLLATAYGFTRQAEPAVAWLKTAAQQQAPDAAFALELARQLDLYSVFALAHDATVAAADRFPGDADLMRALAWRLWQRGEHQAVVSRLSAIDPATRGTDPTLLALKALSSSALGNTEGSAAIADALGKVAGSGEAAAWAIVLRTRIDEAAGKFAAEPRRAVTQYRSALDRDPQNAVAQFLLGEAYARMGESELAQASWEAAASLAPTWAAPHAMIARAETDAGRYPQALRAAEAAYRRAPRDVAVAAEWVVASYGSISSRTGAAAQDEAATSLLKSVEAVQKDAPGEPRTFPIYVDLLARTGRRTDAVAAVRNILAAKVAPPADLLARIAVVSRSQGLGLDDQLIERLGAAELPHPRAALRAATVLRDAGRADEGLRSLTEARRKATAAGSDDQPWALASLQYRDLDDGGRSTLADWTKLTDARPTDLTVQSAALRSPARVQDRALWQRTVARVKELTGPEGQLWQLEQARLTLSAPAGAPENEVTATVALLEDVAKRSPSSAEPRRLLALAYETRARGKSADERRAATDRAVEEISRAAALRPEDPIVAQDLVRIARVAGVPEKVVEHLDAIANSTTRAPDAATRLWLSDAYAELGESKRAADVLRVDASSAEPAEVARLASLRRREGRTPEAADLYRRLLAGSRVEPGSLIEAAEFFADQGQPAEAERVLARLATMPVPVGTVEMARARIAERRGDMNGALSHYQAATKAAGTAAETWRQLCGFLLRVRRFDAMAAAASAGIASTGADEDLVAFRERAAQLAPLADEAQAQPLLNVLSLQPRNDAAVEALRVLADARRAGESPEHLAASVRAAAERFPDFMPLQHRAVRASIDAKQLDAAEQIARRAARAFPADAESARLLAAVYAARGDWPNVKTAALAWRRLSAADPRAADVAVAEALIESGDATGAVERLQPYVPKSIKPTDVPSQAVLLFARGMIASNRAAEAAAMLQPLTRSSPAWRSAWLKLAAAHGDAHAAAQWVTQVAPLFANAPPADQRELAAAWFALGQKFGLVDAYRNVVSVLSSQADPTPEASMLVALAAQSVGDYETGAAAHRRVLEANPASPEAKNNVAYILVLRGREQDVAEARRLAEEAVAARADNATFRDTLARVDAQAGQLDAAIANFRRALEADPYSIEARIGLADALVKSDQRREAGSVLASVEKDVRLAPALPPHLMRQLQGVRTALASAAARTTP